MKILVTGASGFIGKAILTSLSSGHDVAGMVRTDESAEQLKSAGFKTVICDLRFGGLPVLDGFEVVIHCAAKVTSWGRWKDFFEVNVEGTRRIMEAAKAAGVRRFIHMSTESVLADGRNRYDVDESVRYPGKCPYRYSESKKQAEIIVLAGNIPGIFETIALRPRMVWGPGDQTLLPGLLEAVDKGRFKWVNSGTAISSTCHIANLIHAVSLSLDHGKAGQAYFISDGEAWTLRRFFTALLTTNNRRLPSGNLPAWLARFAAFAFEYAYATLAPDSKPPLTRFSAYIMSCSFSIRTQKASSELGYHPKITISEGFERWNAP